MTRKLLSLLALLLPLGVHAANPQVEMKTSLGSITIELYADKAPKTVDNFLQYVKGGFYDGTIFHRVIDGFMIQGGGYGADYAQKPTRGTIENEAANGLKNQTGTIAMARTPDPHSASSQFFINVADNSFLDYRGPTPGDSATACSAGSRKAWTWSTGSQRWRPAAPGRSPGMFRGRR